MEAIFETNEYSGKSVLFLTSSLFKNIESDKKELKFKNNCNVKIENVEKSAAIDSYTPSSFDVVQSGLVHFTTLLHSKELLSKIIKLLKPNGHVKLHQILSSSETTSSDKIKTLDQFKSILILSGYTLSKTPTVIDVSEDTLSTIKKEINVDFDVKVYEFVLNKPNFEIGSSKKITLGATNDVASVWKLDSDDIADSDLIDSDLLLKDDDLKKPDPASLKVCGTTGKRKACKDCSCGLAEELEEEVNTKKQNGEPTPKSSCGSCYLGDAFRCASCPYLGMPAFKPGEKVSISDLQLKSDV